MAVLFTDLTQKEQRDFLKKVWDDSARKKEAKQRLDVYQDKLSTLIQGLIENDFRTNEVKELLKAFAKRQPVNALKLITNEICGAVYNTQPQRTIKTEDNEIERKWRDLLEDSQLSYWAPELLKYAFVANVALAVPRISVSQIGNERVRLEIVLPHQAEVITNPTDPEEIEILGYKRADEIIIVDANSFYCFNEKGRMLEAPIVHGAEITPVSTWRIEKPRADFWQEGVHKHRLDITVNIGLMCTFFMLVRMHQNRKEKIAQIANLDSIPDQPQNDPTNVTLVPQPSTGQQNQFQVLDLQVSPDDFIKEIEFHISLFAQQEGIDYQSTPASRDNLSALSDQRRFLRLGEARDRLIGALILPERDTAYKIALIASKAKLENAIDPELVKENYRLIWNPESYPMNPHDWNAYQKELIGMGAKSSIDVIMELNSGLIREEAVELRDRAIKEEIDHRAMLNKFNMSKDPETNKNNVAELQGKLGSMIKEQQNATKESDMDIEGKEKEGNG